MPLRDDPLEVSELLSFWFGADPIETEADFLRRAPFWFGASPDIDRVVRDRWVPILEGAAAGSCEAWATSPTGRLALILLFDQIPRNAFRGTARAFAYHERAYALSEDGIARGMDEGLPIIQRIFFNMPRGHAEDLDAQQRANDYVDALFERSPALEAIVVGEARAHLETVRRFGRFPERNEALGRPSTSDELRYLEEKRALRSGR